MTAAKDSLCREKEIMVSDLAWGYLGSVKETMKPSTYAMYENYIINEVVPKIGNIAAVKFKQQDLENFLDKCLYSRDGKTRRSHSTMYAIEEVLRAMFRHGVKAGLIPEISLGKTRYGRRKSEHDVTVLSKWEIQRLLHEAHKTSPAQELQVILPLYLGLGLSELCGLKWEDVDLTAGKIYIHRCVKRIMQTNADGSSYTDMVVYELDQREQRMFRLPKNVWEILEQAHDGELETSTGKISPQDESWFVSSLDYKYAEGRTLQYRLKTIGSKAGIENLYYRNLRDTFAVASLKAGANVMTLAKILGINMQVVCDRYGEWMRYDDGFLERIGMDRNCGKETEDKKRKIECCVNNERQKDITVLLKDKRKRMEYMNWH